eukprot:1493249-Rhodomonas_salina.1
MTIDQSVASGLRFPPILPIDPARHDTDLPDASALHFLAHRRVAQLNHHTQAARSRPDVVRHNHA